MKEILLAPIVYVKEICSTLVTWHDFISSPLNLTKPYFYMFGGRLQKTAEATDEIARYDVANDKWTVTGHMAHKRREHRKWSETKSCHELQAFFHFTIDSIIFTNNQFIVVGGTHAGTERDTDYPLVESCKFHNIPMKSCVKGSTETRPELYQNCTLECEVYNQTDFMSLEVLPTVLNENPTLWPKVFEVSDDFCTWFSLCKDSLSIKINKKLNKKNTKLYHIAASLSWLRQETVVLTSDDGLDSFSDSGS